MSSIKRARGVPRRTFMEGSKLQEPRERVTLERFLHLLCLIVLPALVFSNSLRSDYHLDDVYRVKENTEIDRFWPPTRFFTDVRTGSTIPAIAEYRPLMPLSHSVDIQISRALGIPRLAVFHLGNIAIHVASTVLFYFLFVQLMTRWDPSVTRRLGHDSAHAAFAAALIFGVHPIAGSSVNYIVGLDLLLMTFLMLASVHVYLRMRQRREETAWGWALCLSLLWLSLLAKQEAIVAFAFIFLFEVVLARTRLSDWKLWLRTGLFALPMGAYFLLRALWITKQNPNDGLRVPLGAEYPLTMLKAHLFYYFRNYLWPFEIRALPSFETVKSLSDPAALVGLVFILGTLAAAWWFYRKVPLLSFAILSYWLLFSLTASIFPFQYVVTDYRQYVPLAFLALATALVCFTWTRRPVAIGLLAVFVLYSSVSSYEINKHWRTEESFWLQSVKYGGAEIAHVNYALAVAGRDPALAEQHYLEVRRQNPYNVYANMNLGLLYVRQGKHEEGLALLRDVVMRNPALAIGHYWLSRGLGMAGRTQEQLVALRRAAELDPPSPRYKSEFAALSQSAGSAGGPQPPPTSAGANTAEDWLNASLRFYQAGDYQGCIDAARKALALKPDYAEAHNNMAAALASLRRWDEAADAAREALRLKPDFPLARNNLAWAEREKQNLPR